MIKNESKFNFKKIIANILLDFYKFDLNNRQKFMVII